MGEPVLGAIEPLGREVDLAAVLVEDLDAPEVADRVGDRRSDEIARDADDDDRQDLEVPGVDVEAGEQHHRLRGDGDPRGPRDQQHEDPRVAEIVDDRRGDVDQGVRDGCELEHGRGRVALATAMRVWIDLTNSPHPLVLRPVVERLRAGGHDVRGHRARVRADRRARPARRPGPGRDRPPPRGGHGGEGARTCRLAPRRSRAGHAVAASISRSATAPTT